MNQLNTKISSLLLLLVMGFNNLAMSSPQMITEEKEMQSDSAIVLKQAKRIQKKFNTFSMKKKIQIIETTKKRLQSYVNRINPIAENDAVQMSQIENEINTESSLSHSQVEVSPAKKHLKKQKVLKVLNAMFTAIDRESKRLQSIRSPASEDDGCTGLLIGSAILLVGGITLLQFFPPASMPTIGGLSFLAAIIGGVGGFIWFTECA